MSMKSTGSSSRSRLSPSMTERALTGVSNLIKLLPTGTVFMFQFLSPLLSNNGNCNTFNKVLTSLLLAVCGSSCAFACFSDSYIDSNGKTRYGVATRSGIWPEPCPGDDVDMSSYKLRLADSIHAFFSVIVFVALAVLDTNTVECLFPGLEKSENTMLLVLPPTVGAVSSVVFALFPSTRHGIGYAPTSS